MNLSQTAAFDWESQRAFLAVLRAGSLSGAARVLRVAQPTVRRRIEALERQVGAALFTRSPTGLTPTPLARDLAGHAESMALAAAAFVRAASADAEATAGIVRITASEVIGVEVLPAILAELMAEHPGLVIELALDNRNADLLRREADIAVRMVRPTQEALLAKRVGVVRLGFHAHRRLLDLHGRPDSLEALRRLPLIGFEHETAQLRAVEIEGLAVTTDIFSFRSDSDLAQLAAIRAGLGVGVCQIALARRGPELVHLLPEVFAHDLDTWVVMHEDLRTVRRIRLVFERLVARLSVYARAGL